MPPAGNYDDALHKKEETERRDKRKAAKSQKSGTQREKERKRKEHAAKILGKQAVGDSKKRKTSGAKQDDKSKFQELFTQRAQGFQIDFRFRNAPPRPPVGPCFVGKSLDGDLLDLARYKPLNAVEVNYSWKLHSEPDLGVPLAPSAMDPKSYGPTNTAPALHPDDAKLLEWAGSLGDSAAEDLKNRRDHARAAARLALLGKAPAKFKAKAPVSATTATSTKKAFSRVLDETMQSWMKKTTYLSNDYTRKVHDFKSLAKTKQDLVQDLAVREKLYSQRRSAPAISKTFEDAKIPIAKHPSKKNLKPLMEMPFLPNVQHWGNAYTHVVIDKAPGADQVSALGEAFVANVQKKDATARMTCQLFVPEQQEVDENNAKNYQAIQQYELDVLPLKEEDAPHDNYCIWVDPTSKVATYLPISSRVQLSTGRPLKKKNYNMKVSRRSMNEDDKEETDERIAEVDADVEERLKGASSAGGSKQRGRKSAMQVDSDDDSDQGDSFVNTPKTIVAEG